VSRGRNAPTRVRETEAAAREAAPFVQAGV
jgi:hypothetical protein